MAGELKANLQVVVSNHPDMQEIAGFFGIDYVCIARPDLPEADRKAAMEAQLEDVLQRYNVDLVVLAR